MAITLSTDGYCVLADVQAEIQQFTISANSKPSDTRVEGFITQDFAEINGMLRGAGYATPVAQAGGSVTAGGDITVVTAADAGATSLTLTGSNLAGIAQHGDSLRLAGDNQPYMITQTARTNDSSQISVTFSPALELDAAAGTVVTFTAGTDGALALLKLNASMSAIRTLRSAFLGSAESVEDILEGLKEQRDRLRESIRNGDYDFPVIATIDPQGFTISNARLIRA